MKPVKQGKRIVRSAAVLILFAPILWAMLAESAATQQVSIGESHDTSQPIEITADTLEVRQSDNIATFRGDVEAIQGNMLLRADTLVVYYREAEDNEEDLGISRIDADGNVFISSPDETAQGKRGVYDVDNSRIDLAGEVILTQGENIIEGHELRMDLSTGRSHVVSDGKKGRERVRGLFVPQKKRK